MNNDSILNLENFKKQNFIGSGSFADVYKVINVIDGKLNAAKIAKKEIDLEDPSEKKDFLDLAREVNINSKLHHPCIIKFIGYSPVDFDKNKRPVIIIEHAQNDSLYKILSLERKGRPIPGWNATRKLIVLYGIASGMEYLHKHKILHRDLKIGNILLDENLYAKIADFGLSKIYNDSISSTPSAKGTLIYEAPEVLNSHEFSEKSDVYSFAYVVYEIITGQTSFENMTIFQILEKVVRDNYRPKIREDIPSSYRKLIEDCWSEVPSKRPTFTQILQRFKNDQGFITDEVVKDDFIDYVKLIEESNKPFDSVKQVISLDNFKNKFCPNANKKTGNIISKSVYPPPANNSMVSVYPPPQNINSSQNKIDTNHNQSQKLIISRSVYRPK